MRHGIPILWLAGLLGAACAESEELSPDSGPGPDAGSAALGSYEPCPRGQRVGWFAVELREAFTSVQGSVANGVVPQDVPRVEASEGGCELLRPRSLFCNPACTSGMTCEEGGACIQYPENRGVGTVTVSGLEAPVEMQARAPTYFYNFTGSLPHPGFVAGREIRLSASGDGIEPFALVTLAVDKLQVSTSSLALERGPGAELRWTAGGASPAIGVQIELNIANHGGTPARILCETSDTGRFTIPAALVSSLLDLGYSGFPTATLARRGVDSAQTGYGCVELAVESKVVLPVSIPGLISCSLDEDCPPGSYCREDLSCGS